MPIRYVVEAEEMGTDIDTRIGMEQGDSPDKLRSRFAVAEGRVRFLEVENARLRAMLRDAGLPLPEALTKPAMLLDEPSDTKRRLRRRTADLELINALNQAINQGEPLDMVIKELCKGARDLLFCKVVAVYLLSEDCSSLDMQECCHDLTREALPGEPTIQAEGSCTRMPVLCGIELLRHMEEGSSGLVLDLAHLERLAGDRPGSGPAKAYASFMSEVYELAASSSVLLVPLLTDRGPLGLLVLCSGEEPFTKVDLRRIEALVGQLTMAVERKRYEEELRDERERFRVLLHAMTDPLFVHRPTEDGRPGTYVEVNDTACRKLGYGREELLGLSFLDINPPELHERSLEAFRELLDKGHSTLETEHQTKDGRRIPVELNACLFELGGERMVLSVARDLSTRRRLQEQIFRAEKLESLGTLAGGIAHDFRNILFAIQGNLGMVLDDQDPGDESYTLLREAEKACKRAKGLTGQLLTFSKGGSPVKRTATIGELIIESARFSARGSRSRCEFQLAEDMWPVDVDMVQMSQVINNLVINAVQAMPEGGLIRISGENTQICEGMHPSLRLGRHLRIAIEDEGMGIPSQVIGQVFDPYFTTKPGGSGLGLATCYSIIKSHGGLLSVKSELGLGSTFYVYLPASSRRSTPQPTYSPPRQRRAGHILVMDDDESVLAMLQRMLQRLGYSTVAVTDGARAVEIYAEALKGSEPFDAVILDLTVPGKMGGQEALRELSALHPAVTAIVSSGYSTDPVMARYQEYGFAGVASKPYSLGELARVLEKALRG